jgi:hypothetical protein
VMERARRLFRRMVGYATEQQRRFADPRSLKVVLATITQT